MRIFLPAVAMGALLGVLALACTEDREPSEPTSQPRQAAASPPELGRLELRLAGQRTDPRGLQVELVLAEGMTERNRADQWPWTPTPGVLVTGTYEGRAFGFQEAWEGRPATWTFGFDAGHAAILDEMPVHGEATLRLNSYGVTVLEQAVLLGGERTIDLGVPERRPASTGTVVDTSGRPVFGARLSLDLRPRSPNPPWERRPIEPRWQSDVFTDADGSYSLPPVPAERDDLPVYIRANGLAQRVMLVGELRGDDRRIVLQPGYDVVMTACDVEGRPVQEATIHSTQWTWYVTPLVELDHGVWVEPDGAAESEDGLPAVVFRDLPGRALRFGITGSADADLVTHDARIPRLAWQGSDSMRTWVLDK